MSDSQSNIVIDNGSSSIKCGFSGEEAPKSIFSNIIYPSTGKVGDESLDDNVSPIEHKIIATYIPKRIKSSFIWKKYFN